MSQNLSSSLNASLNNHPGNLSRMALSSASTLHASTHSSSPRLQPIIPLRSTRYKQSSSSTKISNPNSMKFPNGIHKGKGTLNRRMLFLTELPAGWEEYTHPDGKPYFRIRKEEWEVVTEVNVRDAKALHDLDHLCATVKEHWCRHPARSNPGRYELYLAIETDNPQGNYYYFVEHDSLAIFWLEDMPLKSIIGNGRPSNMNYEIFILQNYYSHLENFPAHNKLPEGAITLLQNALIYACTDHMTSGDSATSPWTAQESKDFLDLLDVLNQPEARHDVPQQEVTTHNQAHRTWFVARLICVILQNRLVYKYGMIDARIDRHASLKPSIPGVLDYIAGVLSLFAHTTYVQRFENVWGDGVLSSAAWQRLLSSLFEEWSDSNLLATVILSANMAFLALQNLSKVAITASIISTFFSIGSIVTGLHHVWQFRNKRETNIGHAGTYFRNAARLTGNLRPLSFFLSLPFSFLSWSIVAFAYAVSIYAALVVRAYVSLAVLGVVLATVIATILFFWKMVFS